MKTTTALAAAAAAVFVVHTGALAQAAPKLHVNPRWEECSFQLDASLTQAAWHQFTQEAGLVAYFRPLSDARPMGKGRFELSVLQWKTGIKASDAAWNDTFVHPDSTHWLFEGDGLKFPGLMLRAGLSDRTDVGAYFTKSPGANYGFYGLQLQRALAGGTGEKWSLSTRGSFMAIYGPDDLDFSIAGAEVIASRTIRLNRWASLSPYGSTSWYLSRAHEKSAVVDLHDELVPGAQGALGAALDVGAARLGAELSAARVRSFSLKLGVGF